MNPVLSCLFALASLAPWAAAAQSFGNSTADLVLITASHSRQIAWCEAVVPAFKGKTAEYLREIDRVAPGYMESDKIDQAAADTVQDVARKPRADINEQSCNELVFPVARQNIDNLVCHMKPQDARCRASK